MAQQNNFSGVFEDFEKEKSKLIKKVFSEKLEKSKTNNQIPQGGWMKMICENLKISDIAEENKLLFCPFCDYIIYFNDYRGFFICGTEKWNRKKCFSGNLVEFIKFINGGENEKNI